MGNEPIGPPWREPRTTRSPANAQRLAHARVRAHVVARHVHLAAAQQRLQMLAQEIAVEGVRMVEVPALALAQGEVVEVLVIGVLLDEEHGVAAQILRDRLCDQGLARAGPSGDADQESLALRIGHHAQTAPSDRSVCPGVSSSVASAAMYGRWP